MTEIVAGMVAEGESPEDVARRESLEEAFGIENVPRNVYDADGRTICSASTLDAEFRSMGKRGSNKEAAAFVGDLVGKRAVEKGVTTVTFDRGGRIYHGRVKALADGARNAGLKF